MVKYSTKIFSERFRDILTAYGYAFKKVLVIARKESQQVQLRSMGPIKSFKVDKTDNKTLDINMFRISLM